MILIGDKNIECEKIEKIVNIEDIASTSPNSTLLYSFNINILQYTQKNNLASAVVVNSLKEVIYASSFMAKYIIVQKDIVQNAQDIVNNYMLDSKILIIINSDEEIVQNALNEIDGVIYKKVVENGTK
ncbi:MAG: hypothetical protein CSA86_02750 [Arcobacter sp.]|nr:MAG: hypothetical protein CSA86_02750 [Arcobacter sp.]